jgi:hypothetical protein
MPVVRSFRRWLPLGARVFHKKCRVMECTGNVTLFKKEDIRIGYCQIGDLRFEYVHRAQ